MIASQSWKCFAKVQRVLAQRPPITARVRGEHLERFRSFVVHQFDAMSRLMWRLMALCAIGSLLLGQFNLGSCEPFTFYESKRSLIIHKVQSVQEKPRSVLVRVKRRGAGGRAGGGRAGGSKAGSRAAGAGRGFRAGGSRSDRIEMNAMLTISTLLIASRM